MPPPSLKRLSALQASRLDEMKLILARFQERPRDTLNKAIIRSRLDGLNEIWSEVRKTQSDIVARDDSDNDPYIVNNVFADLQTAYQDASDALLTSRMQFEVIEEPALPPRQTDSPSVADADPVVPQLMRMPMPTFSGRYEDWESFCDLFTALVHDVPRYADATKLQFLKTCLKGSAADLVKDVKTTNANYASTWQALKARYHNPRLIISKHCDALMQLPYLRRESPSELRSFADEAQRIVRALANLKLPVEHWDVWLIFVLAGRLDPESRKIWESELSARDRQALVNVHNEDFDPLKHLPTFSDFVEFLERRAQTLNMLAPDRTPARTPESRGEKRKTPDFRSGPGPRRVFHTSAQATSNTTHSRCPLCGGQHPLYECLRFKGKSPQDRYSDVRRLQLCFNCLGRHRVTVCNSPRRCSAPNCQRKHHLLLHQYPATSQIRQERSVPVKIPPERDPSTITPSANVHTASLSKPRRKVVLATAQVAAVGSRGNSVRVRALLDQGSEASFVSESISQLLELPRCTAKTSLLGIGGKAAGAARSSTRLVLRSLLDSRFQIETEALVLPRLTAQLPDQPIVEIDFDQFKELTLADPQFANPNSVDLILGADVYGQLLRSGLKRFSPSHLVAQNTVFGWIVSGSVEADAPRRVGSAAHPRARVQHCRAQAELSEALQRFWTLEEIPDSRDRWKPEEQICDDMFRQTHIRSAEGRYIVRLPVKADPPEVTAETRRMASGSLGSMHRRFSRDHKLAQSYRDFMKAYEELGHMARVPVAEIDCAGAWYLPHHAVVQASETKWKLRVVFDASRQTREGHSLNNFLMKGPPLQSDLSLILLNWRKYRFVFTADIVKMFRQITVSPADQDFQRILWAPSPGEAPVDYRLTTVTYGTNCAPFLAIRTLLQLAQDERARFPLGARCLERHTYVDDIFAGADELSVAVRKRVELTELLRLAGIELDKWAANQADLLPTRAQQASSTQIDSDESVKTLGIHWSSIQDEFRFSALNFRSRAEPATKRVVLSDISRLFDPLGWLAPITVPAKVLMQDLWIEKSDWDSPLPQDIRDRWFEYCDSLAALPELSIHRWLGDSKGRSCQIHGFSDASTRAYAAAIYLRIDDGDGHSRVSLLAAKTKVAPVKTVSIPNLELCGATLLVRLTLHVLQVDFLQKLPIFAWSDSQVVLTWLRKHPSHWKTFVANRVSYIQTELPSATWGHVPTKENPADLATRGSKPNELAQSSLWWHGPSWLSRPPEDWPRSPEAPRILHVTTVAPEPDILTRFSSLTRLTRVVAYCRRPLVKMRRRKAGSELPPPFLSSVELTEARVVIIRLAQAKVFASEIQLLRDGKTLPKRNALRKLNPIVTKDGLLRVGGRLSHSTLPPRSKNPPILPHNSALSLLFARHAHQACLHGGPTLTAGLLMQQVWVLGRNRLVKSTVRKCIICQRVKPRSAQQIMGDLPAERVTPARAFSSTGLDYAGPFQIRATKGRGHKSYKGYIALFVCFTTRAVHLELVSDLTTASFIAAFRRFVGRRGICSKLFSDNASTFHGADKELKGMFKRSSEFYHEVAALLANDGTDWTFIPPLAPHYGGLWEAGVKSTKHHLKRVIGEHTLTFEELSTLLVQIEACLNSRPISPMSSDVDDLRALTPSHFLTGGVSALLPDDGPIPGPENRLDRFQLLQRMLNEFWKRWSLEYLQHLQERGKWRDPKENFAIGQLVLVKDDRYPPSKWPLGRVREVHQGPDGFVRVATVETASSTLRRHITGLCPLSLDQGDREPEVADQANR